MKNLKRILFCLCFYLSAFCQSVEVADVVNFAMLPRKCDNGDDTDEKCSNKYQNQQKFPLHPGSPLTYHGGKLFETMTVYNIFYGGMNYWDAESTSEYMPALMNMPTSKLIVNGPLSLARQKRPNMKLSYGKTIFYYGSPNFGKLYSHLERLTEVVTDKSNPKFGFGKEGSFYMIILDPEYSKPSNFKLSNSISFDSEDSGFCGYHGYHTMKSINYPFSIIGTGGKSCVWYFTRGTSLPNSNFTDITLSVYSHELGEMITNPIGSEFYDSYGFEFGDKCSGTLGGYNYVSGSSGPIYNTILGGRKYLFQARYSHSTDSCPPWIYIE